MNIFFAIQSSYQDIQFGLFRHETLRAHHAIAKKEASKRLIPEIHALLSKQQLSLTDISFIAVNLGPAPFTTLRVVIASMNGLSFASSIPLIGVDAFDAMFAEWQNDTYPTTIILFNAFAHEVYFAIKQPNLPLIKGYQQIDPFLETCSSWPGTIRFIGNGASLYRDKIENRLGSRAHFPGVTDYCSLHQVAQLGHTQWQRGNRGSSQLLPLYLKKDLGGVRLTSSSNR